MTSLRVLAVVAFLCASVFSMPAEVEKRGDDDDGGDIGQGIIQPAEPLLPEPGDEKKKRAYYYYYYSETSSAPNIVPVTAAPVGEGEIIDHAADGGTGKAPGCLPEYEAMPKPHTMCVFDDEPTVTEFGLSEERIEFIVDKHNEYRAMEPAVDMTKMYWDDAIAVIAQKLAQSCHKGHDENYHRLVPGYNIPIGQNWCGGVKTWDKCLELWHNEKSVWSYGKKSNGMIGHFTQMVNTKAVAMGCGFAYCPIQHKQNMVCNYAFGQTAKDLKTPYIEGEPCDSCPGFCVDNLCDCGDKVCKNNGKLNKATCQCQCSKPFKGEICEEVNCDKKDHRACGTKVYIAANCAKFGNLPGLCPRECGLCPRD